MANRNLPTYYLVEADMLPEIFLKVMEANTLSTAESSPVWSRSITWNVRMWPWRRS